MQEGSPTAHVTVHPVYAVCDYARRVSLVGFTTLCLLAAFAHNFLQLPDCLPGGTCGKLLEAMREVHGGHGHQGGGDEGHERGDTGLLRAQTMGLDAVETINSVWREAEDGLAVQEGPRWGQPTLQKYVLRCRCVRPSGCRCTCVVVPAHLRSKSACAVSDDPGDCNAWPIPVAQHWSWLSIMC